MAARARSSRDRPSGIRGENDRGRGIGGRLCTLSTLSTLSTRLTLRTRGALRSLRSGRTLCTDGTLRSLSPLRTRGPLSTLRATSCALRALRALRAATTAWLPLAHRLRPVERSVDQLAGFHRSFV